MRQSENVFGQSIGDYKKRVLAHIVTNVFLWSSEFYYNIPMFYIDPCTTVSHLFGEESSNLNIGEIMPYSCLLRRFLWYLVYCNKYRPKSLDISPLIIILRLVIKLKENQVGNLNSCRHHLQLGILGYVSQNKQ